MATISVLNTSANLSGKTLLAAENDYTITGNHTFDRDPSAPFTVTASSAVVTNLDADLVDGLHQTSFVRVDGSNTLTAGIPFPATQVASAGVNTLDDYEEGTWTPVLGGAGGTSGQTYTTQVGTYIKIGQLVMATYNITLSAKGTITGAVEIQALPVTALTATSATWTHSIKWGNLATTWVAIFGTVSTNTDKAVVEGAAAANTSAGSGLTTSDINNNTTMQGTIIYRANA